MRDLAIALELIVLPQLVTRTTGENKFQDWLVNGAYSLDSSSTDNLIVLSEGSYRDILEYVGVDYVRFLFSSIESFEEAKRARASPKALSWRLIALYYAAYYAAQAICRSAGPFMVRLEGAEVSALAQLASLLELPVKPTKGHYQVSLTVEPYDRVTVALSKIGEKQDGGAHGAFWWSFNKFLDELASYAVSEKLGNANNIVADIDVLQSLLRARGSSRGTFLSSVRNEISYRHAYGGWFPYHIKAAEVDELNRVDWTDSWSIRTDSNAKTHPIEAFIRASQVLVNLSSELATRLAGSTGAMTFKRRLRTLRELP